MLNSKRITLISTLLISIFLISYISFQKYQPKVLKKIEEVKGASTISTDDIPYPIDAVKLGFTQTPKSKITTFKTAKTQAEVVEFYKNIYESKDWKLTEEKKSDHTVTLAYQYETDSVTIIATPDESTNYTVVSVETSIVSK